MSIDQILDNIFILKRVKQDISNDLDKQILWIVLDKFFGFIYGFIFSYVIFSTILYGLENFTLLNSFYNWIIENSYILNNINLINKSILIYLNLTI